MFRHEIGETQDYDFSNAEGSSSSGYANTGWDYQVYLKLAKKLLKAMKGIGTDEAAVYAVFNKVAQSGYPPAYTSTDKAGQIVTTQTLRTAQGLSQARMQKMAILNKVFDNLKNPYTLMQWLRSDLKQSEIRKVNKILVKAGVTNFVV
jgi:hypothetical protein